MIVGWSSTARLQHEIQKLSIHIEVITIITCFVLALFLSSLQAFGGYLTLKMLATTDKLFQCTAAVAPITDFRLYSELQSCHKLFKH